MNVDEPDNDLGSKHVPIGDLTTIVPADTDIPSLTPDRIDIDWMFDSFLDAPKHDWAELLTSDVGPLREENAACDAGFQVPIQLNEFNDKYQEENWSNCQSHLRSGLSQLDGELLSSSFFDPENLRKFYELYFQHYHPHFPILHQPTLNLASTNPLLLGALLGLGSTLIEDRKLFELGQRVHDGLHLIIINVSLSASGEVFLRHMSDQSRLNVLHHHYHYGAYKHCFCFKLMGK